mgnify:FL=1
MPPLAVAAGQIFFGLCFNFIGSITVDFIWPIDTFDEHWGFMGKATLKSWLSIVYLGVASTVVAYALYFYLIRTIGSVKQTLVGYLLPVFGVAEGAAFLSEWSGVAWYFIVIEVVGAILICGGIFFVNSGKSTPAAPARGTDDFDTEKFEINAASKSNGFRGAYGTDGEYGSFLGGSGEDEEDESRDISEIEEPFLLVEGRDADTLQQEATRSYYTSL